MTVVDEINLSIIIEDPSSEPTTSSNQPNFRPRRCHTKSRNGCIICKRRRIKCDEAQPECSYCWEKGIRCRYTTPHGTSSTKKEPLDSSKIDSINEAVNLPKSVEKEALLVLERHCTPCDRLENGVYKQSVALDLLVNFVERTDTLWIGSLPCQEIMQRNCLRLASDAPYFLHAVLAYSATFSNYLYPEEKKYSIAKTLYYQKSLQQFLEHLDTDFREDDADAMMAAAVLLSMLCFIHTTTDQEDRTSNAPFWVRTWRGKDVLYQTPVLLPGFYKGIWSEHVGDFAMWKKLRTFGTYLDISSRSTEDVEQIRSLGNLCFTAAPEHRELFQTPIFMLEHLAQLQPNLESGKRFVYFMAMLHNDFIALLDAENPFAMLIIAFWCALLSKIDQWWIVRSSGDECRRICHFIEGLGDARFNDLTRYLVGICTVTAKQEGI